MKKIKSLESYRLEREGIDTVESVINNLHEAMKQGLVKDIVYVAVNSDGEIVHACNTMDALRAIGLLDTGITQIKDNLRE